VLQRRPRSRGNAATSATSSALAGDSTRPSPPPHSLRLHKPAPPPPRSRGLNLLRGLLRLIDDVAGRRRLPSLSVPKGGIITRAVLEVAPPLAERGVDREDKTDRGRWGLHVSPPLREPPAPDGGCPEARWIPAEVKNRMQPSPVTRRRPLRCRMDESMSLFHRGSTNT
jgi:hypothetical protein